MTIKDTQSALNSLNNSVTQVSQSLYGLDQANQLIQKSANALTGGVLDLELKYREFQRTLQLSETELTKTKDAIDRLSKSSDYYAKNVLASMYTELSRGTSVVAIHRQEHEKLVKSFATTFKQDADKYLQTFRQMAQEMPILTAKMSTGVLDLGTRMELLKRGGTDAVNSVLAAMQQLNSEIGKSDKLVDTLSKLDAKSKNVSLGIGQQVYNFASENPGTAAAGAIGGYGLLKAGIAYGPSAYGAVSPYLGMGVGNLARSAVANTIGSAMWSGGGAAGASSLVGLGGLGLVGAVGGYGIYNALQLREAVNDTYYEGGTRSADIERQRQEFITGKRLKGAYGDFGYGASQKILAGLNPNAGALESYDVSASALEAEFTGGAAYQKLIERSSAMGMKPSEEQQNFLNRQAMLKMNIQQRRDLAAGLTSGQLTTELAQFQYSLGTNPNEANAGNLLAANDLAISQKQKQISSYEGLTGFENQVQQLKKELITLQQQRNQAAIASGTATLAQSNLRVSGIQSQQQAAILGGINLGDLDQYNQKLAEEATLRARAYEGQIKQLDAVKNAVQIADLNKKKIDEETTARQNLIAIASRQIFGIDLQKSVLEQAGSLSTKGLSVESGVTLAGLNLQKAQMRIEALRSATSPEEIQERTQLQALLPGLQQGVGFAGLQQTLFQKSTALSFLTGSQGLSSVGAGGQNIELASRIDLINTELLNTANKLSDSQKQQLENEKKILETRMKFNSEFGKESQNLQFQAGMNSIAQQAAGITRNPFLQAQAVRQGIDIQRKELTNLEIERQTRLSGPNADVEKINQEFDLKVAQKKLGILQSIDFQRRTFAEQFTADSFGKASGSYLFSGQPSQYSVLGSGYYEGISANGPKEGTYQTQIAQMFGEGMSEKTPIEQLYQALIGEGVTLKPGTAIKVDMQNWDGQSPLNAVIDKVNP